MTYTELRNALLSKGEAEEDRTGDHPFFYIEVDGKSYRAIKFSHGAKGQISGNLLSQMSHQMRLTNKELKRFVDCTMGGEKWLDLWRQRGHTWRSMR